MSEAFISTLFIILGWLIFFAVWQIYRQTRSILLRKIAKKYNLDYKKNFYFFYPSNRFNEISGWLNNHKVTIYDSVSWSTAVGGIISYRTISQIDGVQTQSEEKTFLQTNFIDEQIKNLMN